MTGDWMLSVGLVYTVYDVTGSTLASAGALMAAFVPQVVTGLFAGVFVDRWSRARTMVVGNLLMAVGITPLLLVHGARRRLDRLRRARRQRGARRVRGHRRLGDAAR